MFNYFIICCFSFLFFLTSCAPKANVAQTNTEVSDTVSSNTANLNSTTNDLPHCGHEVFRLETTRCVSELSGYNWELNPQSLELVSDKETLSYNAPYDDVYYEVVRLVRASDWHLKEHDETTGVVVADNTIELCQSRTSSYYLPETQASQGCVEFFQDVVINLTKGNNTTVSFQIVTDDNVFAREKEALAFLQMLSANLNTIFS